jgi:hypothetical protein
MGLLSLLVSTFFILLDISLRSFQQSILRHSLQADTQRISYRLTEDLRRSHFLTVSKLDLTSGGPAALQRDAICIAVVKDWSSPTAIDSNSGRPTWNRYALYYCRPKSDDEPVTELYRCLINPSDPNDMGQFAYPPLNPGLHCVNNPRTVSDFENINELSNLLERFEVTSSEDSQWRVTFCLRERRAKRTTRAYQDQILETTIQVRPENTFPVYY